MSSSKSASIPPSTHTTHKPAMDSPPKSTSDAAISVQVTNSSQVVSFTARTDFNKYSCYGKLMVSSWRDDPPQICRWRYTSVVLSHNTGGWVSQGGVVFTLARADSVITRCIHYCHHCNSPEELPVYISKYLERRRVHSFLQVDAVWSAPSCTARADPL